MTIFTMSLLMFYNETMILGAPREVLGSPRMKTTMKTRMKTKMKTGPARTARITPIPGNP